MTRIRVDDKNSPFKLFRDFLGDRYEEFVIPNPYGAVIIRTWSCGCTIIRAIRLNFERGMYEMFDEPQPCERHKKLIEMREHES